MIEPTPTNIPRLAYPITARLTAFDRIDLEARGLNPDDHFTIPAQPLMNSVELHAANGYIYVRGVFVTPMQAISPLALLAGNQEYENLIGSLILSLTVRKDRTILPKSDTTTMFAATCKPKDGFEPMVQRLVDALPAVAWRLADGTVLFTALTYAEAGMISYRLQQLGIGAVCYVDPTIIQVSCATLDEGTATVLPRTPTPTKSLVAWDLADRTALWTDILRCASPIERPALRAQAEMQGMAIPLFPDEGPAHPFVDDALEQADSAALAVLLQAFSAARGD